MKYTVTVEDETFEIEVDHDRRVWVNRRPYDVDLCDVDGMSQYSLLVDHRSYEAHVEQAEDGECRMLVGGRPYHTCLEGGHHPDDVARSETSKKGPPQTSSRAEVQAPLPGLLIEMRVTEGERVDEKDIIAVLESMKMNLELRAPQAGVVSGLCAAPGHEVGQGEVLAIIEPEDIS